jgi:Protein of unknown function (DUF1064)
VSARGHIRWTAEDIARTSARISEAARKPLQTIVTGNVPSRRKYKNRTTIFQGQQFDSERECAAWKNFELQRIAGAIRAVVNQVSFRLPGTQRRIRVDFLVVELDGRQVWYDAKGYDNPKSALKRQQVFDAYGIQIHLI